MHTLIFCFFERRPSSSAVVWLVSELDGRRTDGCLIFESM